MSALRTTRPLVATAMAAALLAGGAQVSTPAAQAAPQPARTVNKAKAGQATTTSDLSVRSQASTKSKRVGILKKGSRVAVTGKRVNGMAQIRWQGKLRWVSAKYLKGAGSAAQTTTAQPLKAGILKATVTLAIREQPSTASKRVGTIAKGNEVAITGKQVNGMAQLYWMGNHRWVSAKYLSRGGVAATPQARNRAPQNVVAYNPLALPGSTVAAKRVAAVVTTDHPQIRTIHGIRIDPGSDHHTGRAVDVMLPNYRSNQALGWEIANQMRSRADELGITYVIFQQKIWSVARDGEGWRPMADRGNDTQNHIDHVHVSVR
ncbi:MULTISPECIES: SH3 domain-containing protein [unclassified Luteococcus]|uniref:SH3 domain-containing protein n=1 Tax=unclassified Luteococcus TaxID=2639923 RepID=UPI00313B4BDA